MNAAAVTYARFHFRRAERLDGGQLELALDWFRESLSRSTKLRALVKRSDLSSLGEVRLLLALVVSLYGASARLRFEAAEREAEEEVSAQPAQKPKGGRPKGGDSESSRRIVDRRPVRRLLFEHLERIFEDRLAGDGWPSRPELRALTVDILQEFGFADMADPKKLGNTIRQRNHEARQRTTARRCDHCSTPARGDVLHGPGEPCPGRVAQATDPR